MNATHTLARVETAVHMRLDGTPCESESYQHKRCPNCHGPAAGIPGKHRGAALPAFGSALIVPPPPDYSTPAAITARCREAGYDNASDLRTAGNDRTFKKAYRELRQAIRVARPEYPGRKAIGWCRVEDTHVSKWVIERDRDGALTLNLASRPAATRRGKVA